MLHKSQPVTEKIAKIPLVWVGHAPPDFLKKKFDVIHSDDPLQVGSLVDQFPGCILISDLSHPLDSVSLLKSQAEGSRAPIRILAFRGTNFSVLQQAVNVAQIFSGLDLEWSEERQTMVLQRAVEVASEQVLRQSRHRELTKQVRELESITQSLEGMVADRTAHIESSQKEQEESLARTRGLVRFLNDLGKIVSVDELLNLFRKEIKKFHKLGEPLLLYRISEGKARIYSFKGGHAQMSETSQGVGFTRTQGFASTALARDLANIFGRPFVKPVVFPLDVKLFAKASQFHPDAMLIVECQLPAEDYSRFVDFMSVRSQFVAMTLDRLMLEDELLKYSFRWEKTFDGMRDPLAIIDIEYDVLRANRTFSGKVFQHKCYESFAGRTSPCEGCPLPEVERDKQMHKGTVAVGHRVFEVSSFPIVTSQGDRVTTVVNQYVDVTQSRELYLRMLQTEKLEAIGLLAGNIAHELNNPLTGIRSLSQVLQVQDDLSQELKADLHEIEKAAARSQKIIKDLLDFSVGGDQRELTTLDEIVQKTMPMLKTALRMHRLNLDLSADTAKIRVEPHLIQQVFFNLVNNACQAMKEKGTLSVSTRQTKTSVVLKVEDSGPGIAKDLLEKIFEPFFTTKKEGLGTGLGLSLSRKIIDAHQGSISAESEVGRGAAFTVELPIDTGSTGALS